MSLRTFHTVIRRFPETFNKLCTSSRCYHSILNKDIFQLYSRSLPTFIVKYPHTFLRLYSQTVNLEKENQNILEVPSIHFQDVDFDHPVSHEELISALQKQSSITDQMKCLVETLALSSDDLNKREQFCRSLESLLKPFFNDFKIQIFGSTMNGFGFKGCDIDLTFETSAQQKDKSCYLERPDVPMVSEVLGGKVSVQQLSELPLKEQLLFIHTVFLEFWKWSEVPAKFINAHVPLVRFYHDKYNLKCDLTMKNKVAFANTKLLYLYSKLDERVTPLMMSIRYWAKYTELIGKGLNFNTYTITLLVIYFLQTRNPPILPSAEFILSMSDKFDTEDMKDKSFLDLLVSLPPTKNKQSIEELFKEFFFFYLYFDFTRVICPMTATAITRDEFFSQQENNRFQMNTLCVQDPLSLKHNVAELVDYKHARKFFTELVQMCKMIQNREANDSNSRTILTKEFNLITVFDKPKEYSIHKISHEKTVSFDLHLPSHTSTKATNDLLYILQKVLLFECNILGLSQVVNLLNKHDQLVAEQKREWELKGQFKLSWQEAIPHLKNRKKKSTDVVKEDKHSDIFSEETLLEQFQKFNSDHKLILCAECKVSRNTWLGRDNVDLANLSSDDILVREKSISEIVAKQNALHFTEQQVKPFQFLFESYISPLNSDKLVVNFRPIQRMSFNPILGIFLKEYVPNIMKKLSS